MSAARHTARPAGRTLVLLGGGGHAAVVADAARAAGWSVAGYLDDAGGSRGPESTAPLPWLGRIDDLKAVLASLEPGAAAHAGAKAPRPCRGWGGSMT